MSFLNYYCLFLVLAVSPSNNEIHVFQWQNGRWTLAALLAEHDLPITGLDWAPKTNRIVSCAQASLTYGLFQ